MQIPIDRILPNPDQPRTAFDQGELDALAASIAQHGLINPVSVEQSGDDYILIDGERRWRAARQAGHTASEASVREAGKDRLVLALTANIQRADMNPMEQARALRRLVDAGYKQDDIARMINVSVGTVYNYLRLLIFDPRIQDLIEQRKLPFETTGWRALSRIEDVERQVEIAQAAASAGVSGPGLFRLIRRMGLNKPQTQPVKAPRGMTKTERAELAGGRWNMIAQLGRRPPELYAKAAERTCESCSIYSIASSTNCQECPGVELLRQLTAVGEGKNGKVHEPVR